MDTKEVGKYLRKLRGNRTIGQIHRMSGVSSPYISQLERGLGGVPSPLILSKLAKAYMCPYEDLLKAVGYLDGDNTVHVQGEALPQKLQEYDVVICKIQKALENKSIFPEDVETILDIAKKMAKKAKKKKKDD